MSRTPAAQVARVLVDSPLPQLDRLFDYRIPEPLRPSCVPGVRVRVPLRSAGRIVDGFVIELGEPGDFVGPVSEIDSVVSTVRVLTADVWSLARRLSDRAAGSAGDILRLAVPRRQVRVEKAWLARDRSGESVVVVGNPLPIEGYGRGIVEAALSSGERVALEAIPVVRQLQGAFHAAEAPDERADRERAGQGGSERWVGSWAVTMAAAAAATLARGKSSILVVPDFRDQDQLEAALRAVLPHDVIVRVDARQSNPDRYRAFLRCLDDRPVVILGNRSAVYAPAFALGLIAMWDDGDPLYGEPLSPYVHSRDAALIRQEQQGCALILLSHTRSTEVERLIDIGWLRHIPQERRLLPKVVPTFQQSSGDRLAAGARIPSSAWKVARAALERGPVLVQVARPGYAPRLACVACDHTARCLRCEGPLAQRDARSVPACQWCGALAVDWRCSNCEATTMRFVGIGANRTADELGRAFPGVRVIVADGERPILTVEAEPALVIATRGAEPVAHGGYRAVLLLDGERMVTRESLRVGEDCLRWWSNAVALAAPGAQSILVGVGGALATALVTWRQSDYARAELADRQRLRFPPAVRIATITGAPSAVASAVESVAAETSIPPSDILGPVSLDAGTVRMIVRFDYARGSEVSAALRAAVIAAATHRRRPKVEAGYRPSQPPVLRTRVDDIEPFLETQY